MSHNQVTQTVTIALGAATGANIRVTAAGAIAGLADQAIGVTRVAGALGESVGVQLLTGGGYVEMVASKAITAGAKVYGVAAGKVSDAQGSGAYLQGIARTAAGADKDIIDVYPVFGEVPKGT